MGWLLLVASTASGACWRARFRGKLAPEGSSFSARRFIQVGLAESRERLRVEGMVTATSRRRWR